MEVLESNLVVLGTKKKCQLCAFKFMSEEVERMQKVKPY